jgi:diaminopimelate decarboxylase
MSIRCLDGEVRIEDVDAASVAERFGTPSYVYSRAAIEAALDSYLEALDGHPHLLCYAVKANSNLAVLQLLAARGAGFDIVSVGELERVLAAGGDPARVVFSGVVKQRHELRRALEVGIRCFNLESAQELDVLQDVAAAGDLRAPVSVRVNPDVDARTHPYISTGMKENKFGVEREAALQLSAPRGSPAEHRCRGPRLPHRLAADWIRPLPRGTATHLLDLVDALATRASRLPPPRCRWRYRRALPPGRAAAVDRGLRRGPAPGRGRARPRAGLRTGTLHRRQRRPAADHACSYLKETPAHRFALVDAAMNDFIRPALYAAWVDIRTASRSAAAPRRWDIVGPVCETADFLGHDRELALEPGSLLAVLGAGAYGFVDELELQQPPARGGDPR